VPKVQLSIYQDASTAKNY